MTDKMDFRVVFGEDLTEEDIKETIRILKDLWKATGAKHGLEITQISGPKIDLEEKS